MKQRRGQVNMSLCLLADFLEFSDTGLRIVDIGPVDHERLTVSMIVEGTECPESPKGNNPPNLKITHTDGTKGWAIQVKRREELQWTYVHD